MNPTLSLDTQFAVAKLDPRVFGGFAEHLGRCVYEGMYDPGSPLADADGFRTDVIDAIRKLRMPVMRYPGGNFVSCYDWRDGIGPREKRPAKIDYAWQSVESNQFGTDEFMTWCKKVGTQPMKAVNLGTAGAQDAAALLEYCNLDTPTYWADLRRKNGAKQPYGVKLWCLGNEMDGPWQAGHVPAREYGLRANAAARMMKGLDPSIETVACGSSGNGMTTYLDYDRETLEIAWDNVDYVSAHRYSVNDANDTPAFLAEGVEIDRVLEDYAGLLNYVRGKKRSKKRVYVSFDEWNVWYKDRGGDGKWKAAPHLLEEVYNVEDALVVAQYLQSFIARADLVKVACLAQIVNVIAPLLTKKDGLLVQSIYYPIEMLATHAKGKSLRLNLQTPMYAAGARGECPAIHAAATFDEATGRVMVSAVHRDSKAATELSVSLADRTIGKIAETFLMTDSDMKRANTWEKPQAVKPTAAQAKVVDGTLRLTLPPQSHAVVVFETTKR
ncbi:MAG: alpha-N-arabinofuranosidase [Tepidisphaeraceae bacterium]